MKLDVFVLQNIQYLLIPLGLTFYLLKEETGQLCLNNTLK